MFTIVVVTLMTFPRQAEDAIGKMGIVVLALLADIALVGFALEYVEGSELVQQLSEALEVEGD